MRDPNIEVVLRRILFLIVLVGAALAWWLTAPARVSSADFTTQGDAKNGALIFAAGGCSSCHSAPNAEGEEKLILSGGRAFASDFGTFYAPNISFGPSGAGIAEWTVVNLGDAVLKGTSTDGKHYYPAFPYTSYRNMTPGDVDDLYAYMRTLPPSDAENRPHDVGFPFNIRRSLGGWKLLFQTDDWALQEANTPELERGRYLVETLGHCTECHTSRNLLGGLKRNAWLGGAPNPSGKGRIPNITPGTLQWSQEDLVNYFKSGFTPDFDTAGGEMVDVVENLSKLPEEDLQAIAAYLLAIPTIEKAN